MSNHTRGDDGGRGGWWQSIKQNRQTVSQTEMGGANPPFYFVRRWSVVGSGRKVEQKYCKISEEEGGRTRGLMVGGRMGW